MVSEYRSRAEVLRFVSAEDNLLVTSLLSRSWHDVSCSEEAWRDLCESYDIIPSDEHPSSKETFREGYFSYRMLPVVCTSSIRIYSVPDLSVVGVKLLSTVDVDQFTAYCFLSTKSLLFSGGCNYTTKSYKADLTTGEVTALSPMNANKRSHALFRYRRDVFSFGGYHNRNLDLIEKYSISANTWTILDTTLLTPMEGLVPARYHHSLYLVGAETIEVFDLLTLRIALFPLKLPQRWFYCLAHVSQHGDLVILQRDKVIRGSVLAPLSELRATTMRLIANGNYWSNSTPVRFKGALYFVQNTHGTIETLLKLDLTTDVITTEMKIEYNKSL